MDVNKLLWRIWFPTYFPFLSSISQKAVRLRRKLGKQFTSLIRLIQLLVHIIAREVAGPGCRVGAASRDLVKTWSH